MSELPKGWAECSLEDLLGPLSDGKILHQGWSPQCESTPAPKGEWGVLKTTAVQDGYFLEDENKALPSALSPKPELEVKAGDLLMTCAGPRSRCGVICHVPKTREKLIFSGKIYRFRPNAEHVESKFLTHLLRTAELKEKIDEIKTGISESGMNMTRERFFALPVRLAPLAEQTRIAQKLDELLAQVDTLKARIDGIPALLKRFRQSVLTAAVSGRLTEEWRVQNFGSAGEDKPAGWLPKSLPELGELARGKSKHRPRNDERLFGGKYPFIQTGEVANSAGRIKTAKVFYSDFGLAQSRLFPKGTLCITIAANIADTAILDLEACFPDSVVGFVADEGNCCAQFIKYLVDVNKQNLEAFAPATAQKNINLKVLSELVLPMPPLAEQTEIVRRVEQLFAFADQLESKVASAKSRIDHLTQSILAKAFRGELVPQDPNDEPASELLARIKAQRAAAPKTKRGRKSA